MKVCRKCRKRSKEREYEGFHALWQIRNMRIVLEVFRIPLILKEIIYFGSINILKEIIHIDSFDKMRQRHRIE